MTPRRASLAALLACLSCGPLAEAESLTELAIVARSQSPAAPVALCRLMLLRDVFPRTVLQKAMAALAEDPALEPEQRSTAARFMAELLRGSGALDQALATWAATGLLVDGLRLRTPTAAAADLTRIALRDGFRDVPGPWPGGVLPIGQLVSDTRETAADRVVVASAVWSDRKRPARLSTAAGERTRLSFNRVAVTTGAVTLLPGWNLVLVESQRPGRGPWTLQLALTAPDGAPLQLPRPGRAVDLATHAFPKAQRAAHAVVTPLVSRFRDATARPLAERLDVLLAHGRADAVFDPKRVVEQTQGKHPAAHFRAALRYVRGAERVVIARRWLAQAPDDPEPQVALARATAERGQTLRAVDLVRAVLAKTPADLSAQLLEAELLADLQLTGHGRALLARLSPEAKTTPAAIRTAASLAQRRGLPEEARAHYAQLATMDTDGEALYWLTELDRGLGRGDSALTSLEQLVRAHPGVPGHRLQHARLLAELGRADAARAVLEETTTLFPNDPEPLDALARLAIAAGDRKLAAATFRRSLALRPHQPELRTRLERLEPVVQQDWGARGDVERLARLPATTHDAGNLELLHLGRVLTVDPGGTTRLWTQQVLRVLRAEPSAKYTVTLPYDPTRQSVTLLDVRRRDPSGAWRDDARRTELDLSESWYRLYYEQKAVRVTFEKLAVGETLVLEWRQDDAAKNLFSGVVGDLVSLDGEHAIRSLRYRWVFPAQTAVTARLTAEGKSTPIAERLEGEHRVLTLDADDVPRVVAEPGMPGPTESLRAVHVSTLSDANALAAWYQKLTARAGPVAPSVIAKARELAPEGAPPAEVITAVHRFATRDIRYVGLEFGVHSYKPYEPDEVLARRYGDCKDKASLMRALLAVRGIDSNLVLVRTRPRGRLLHEVASPAAFDHAILYLPSLDRFVDPTAAHYGPRELPAEDAGATALIVSETGGRWVELPLPKAEDNGHERTTALNLSGDRLAVHVTHRAFGIEAARLRQRFAVPATRNDVVERELARERPGARLEKASFTGFDGLGTVAVAVSPTMTLEATETLGAGFTARVRVLGDGLSLLRAWAPLATRTHALGLDAPMIWRWHTTLTADAGWGFGAAVAALRSGEVESKFGRVRVTVERTDGTKPTVTVAVEVRLDVVRIAVADYVALRSFLREADDVLAPFGAVEVRRD